jgi:small subunit ribosomal protein S3
MGQKVSPNGLRLGINKDWTAKWYADKKDFANTLLKDIKIREYLTANLVDAGIAKVEIERSPKKTEVIIHTSKPGVMIGRGGEEIDKLKNALAKISNENIQISIVDIKKADLNAQLVADSIANQISNRASFRMAQKRAIRNAMKAGAKGVKTLLSGRLGGAEMARREGYSEGTIPLHTLRADVDYAASEAATTYGKIGVKVWIYKGEILNKKSSLAKLNVEEEAPVTAGKNTNKDTEGGN